MAYGVGSSGVIGRGSIALSADTRDFDAAMSRVEKRTVQGADTISAKFTEAGKALTQSQIVSNMETIGALGIQVGGTVSQLSSVFTSLIRPVAIVGTAFGTSTVAAVGLGVAIGAIPFVMMAAAGAAISLGHAAGEAGERLAEMGLLAQEDARFVQDMRDAADAAAAATDRLTISLAQGIPGVEDAVHAWAGFKGLLADTAEVLPHVQTALERLISPLSDVDVIGRFNDELLRIMLLDPAGLGEYGRRQEELVATARKNVEVLKQSQKESARLAQQNNDEIRELKRLKDQDLAADKAREREIAQERREAASAHRKDMQEAEQLRRRELEYNENVLQQLREQFQIRTRIATMHNNAVALQIKTAHAAADATLTAEAQLTRLNAQSQEYFSSFAYGFEVFKQYNAEALKFGQAAGSALAPYFETVSVLFDDFNERAQRSFDIIQQAKESNREAIDAWDEADDKASRNAIRRQIAINNATIDGQRSVLAEQRKVAHRLWMGDQAAKITQAIMAGSVAIMQGYAQLGPIGGSVAAIGIGALTTAQVAIIASQKPPKYHVGGRIRSDPMRAADEVDARMLSDEGAVSRRGMSVLGDDGLRAVNEGRAPFEVTLHNTVVLDGKVIERTVRRLTGNSGRRNIHADRG